jgi:hypothetical protein
MIDGTQSGPDLAATATSYTPSASLTDGTHSWQVFAFDQVGNVQPGPTWHVIVDTRPPNAAISTDRLNAVTGATVTLDASGSTDPEGASITSYEWDPEGAGAFRRSPSTSSTFTHAYSTPGTYHAAVRVTNEVGLNSTASVTVTVHPAPPSGPTGVSVDNAALYTNDPNVTLNVVWPAGADAMLVSNDGGFGDAQRFPVATSVSWTLDSAASERLPKTVYVRFDDGTQTFTDDIILDTVAPLISRATLARSKSAATSARATARRYRVSLTARDDNSGLAKMQITANRANPGPLLRFAANTVYRAAAAPRWVRVRDRAGNFSRWHAISGAVVPVLYGLHVSPRTFVLAGRMVNGRCARVTRANRRARSCRLKPVLRVDYRLSIPARVTFTLKQQRPGRLVGGRCVAPTRRNRGKRGCVSWVPLRGSLVRQGAAGANSFAFDGRIGGHTLAPGTYRLIATPSANGATGRQQAAGFKIQA